MLTYYDSYSLFEASNKSGMNDIFVFDDICTLDENFNFNAYLNYPIRLGLVVIAVCKKGYIKLQIGLEDIHMTPNMVVIMLAEQIFQCTDISPDFDAAYILLGKDFFDIQNILKSKVKEDDNLFLKEVIQTYIRALFYSACNLF